MGCTHSATFSFSGGAKRARDREQEDRQAKLEARMQAALKEIILHKATDDTQASFTRIILKFPALRVFKRFDEDGNGTIDREELTASLEALGAHLSEAEVNDMFSFSNMTESGVLSFKEYVLCLAIGSVLQLFPALKAYAGIDLLHTHRESGNAGASTGPGSASATASAVAVTTTAAGASGTGEDTGSFLTFPSKAIPDGPLPLSAAAAQDTLKGSSLHAHGVRLVKALRVVLEAYVLFDRDASGTIDRNEVLEMIDEENSKAKATTHAKRGKEAGHNALLSKERWLELDWDGDGQITFKEFLFAFMEWVGVDDDDDDDTGGMPDDPISARIVEREIDQSLALPRKLSTTSQTSLRLSPEALAAAASGGAMLSAGGAHRIVSVRAAHDGGASRVAARAIVASGGATASARSSGTKTSTPDLGAGVDVTAGPPAVPVASTLVDSDTREAHTTVLAPTATMTVHVTTPVDSGPGSYTTMTATVITAAPHTAAGLVTTTAANGVTTAGDATATRTNASHAESPPALPGAVDS